MGKAGIRNNSISVRLMVYFVCIILVPISILSFFMLVSYRKNIERLVEKNARESLGLINYNMDQQFISYSSLAYFISRDRQLQEVSQYKDPDAYNEDTENKRRIGQLLKDYRLSVDEVYQVVISYAGGTCIMTGQEDAVFHHPETQDWYRLCRKEQDTAHVLYYEANARVCDGTGPVNQQLISVSHSIKDREGNFIGAVNVEMYSRILENSMSNILSRNGSYVYVKDKTGQIIYSPIVGSVPESAWDKNYCQVELHNKRNDWDIVGVVPLGEYYRSVDEFASVLWLFMAVITSVMIFVSVKTGSSIVRPIKTLQELMSQAEAGDLSVRFRQDGPREIVYLGERFNVMIARLDYHIRQVYIEQKAKRKAEMEILQANIRPHFLYNTLDTIHWMAKEYEASDIVETVDALASLFRIALSRGSETITVAQEIQHVTSYLQIQKVRYEEMISYEVHVAKNCERLKVQKLILQPLIENAIYHGIKNSGKNGRISIYVWKEKEDLFLAVEDDGSGMSKERLNEVQMALKGGKAETNGVYGVFNVHYRILLNYGEPYGLYLKSERGVGTTALLRHPALCENIPKT